MHVAFRADGGPEIGFGHLFRSCALVEEMLTRGHLVTVATTTPQPAQAVYSDAVEIIELPARGDPAPFVEWLATVTPDIVFTDAYPVDTEYQRSVRNLVPLAVLQDDSRHVVCADLFVNGNLYAGELDYEFVGQEPETCLGTDYVLLRSEILKHVAKNPPWREHPERAIITMGGSDMAELTPTVIRAFDGFNLHVDAVVGPGFSKEQERDVHEAVSDISAEVWITRAPEDLAELMFQADFAVSTASSTTYELLALGTPIVSIPIAENQEPIAEALRSKDAATVIERENGETAFRRAAEGYMFDSSLRRERRSQGRDLVDGKGVERIFTKILAIVEG